MHHFLACYDVSDNRARSRVERLLQRYGNRVQKSVFEISISINDLTALLEKSKEFLEATDSLRVYQLCLTCRRASKNLADTEWRNRPDQLVV